MEEKWLKLLDDLEEIRQVICETKKGDSTRTVIDDCMKCIENADIPSDAMQYLLGTVEERKKKAKDRPLAYPADFTVRCICADVANFAGYEGRTEWTGLLKKKPESKYAGRIEGRTGVFHL